MQPSGNMQEPTLSNLLIYGGPPVQQGAVSRQALVRMVNDQWQQAYDARSGLNTKVGLIRRALAEYNNPDYTSQTTLAPWSEGIARAKIRAYKNAISAALFPKDLPFFSLEPTGLSENAGAVLEATSTLFEQRLEMINFKQRMANSFKDAAAFYGSLVMVFGDEIFDERQGRMVKIPNIKIFPWEDFVLTYEGDTAAASNVIIRYRLPRYSLKKMAERGVFDANTVAELIARPSQYSPKDNGAMSMAAPIAEGKMNSTMPNTYEVVEAWGCFSVDGKNSDYRVVSICQDKVLRDVPNPYANGMKPFHFVQWDESMDGDIYGDSMGFDLMSDNVVINDVMRLVRTATELTVLPPLVVDADSQDDNDDIWLEAGRVISVDMKNNGDARALAMNPRVDVAMSVADRIRDRSDQKTGLGRNVTTEKPKSDVTATAISADVGAGALFVEQDAERMQGHLDAILKKLYLIFEMTLQPEEIVNMGDGVHQQITLPQVQQMRGKVRASGWSQQKRNIAQMELTAKLVSLVTARPEMSQYIKFKPLVKMIISYFPGGSALVADLVKEEPSPAGSEDISEETKAMMAQQQQPQPVPQQ